MKNIALVLLAIVLVSSLALSADMAKQGQWGVNTSVSIAGTGANAAGFKYMLSDNMALRAGLAFSSNSPGGGGNTTTDLGIAAGLEFHQTAVGGVSPYFGIGLGYGTVSTSGGNGSPNAFSVSGVYGGEYFFSSNFSLAGDVGIKFTSMSSGGTNSVTSSSFGTTGVAGLTATWYLN